MVKDKFPIFKCGGQGIIKNGQLEMMKEVEEEHGGKFIHPKCTICSQRLRQGDYLDGFHPYHQEYNLCYQCRVGANNDIINCHTNR